jgi:transposase
MAPPRIEPVFENCTLQELDVASACAPSLAGHERLLAIRMLGLGIEREKVALVFNIAPRTLTRWIEAFNDRGIDGLLDKPKSGRPRKIGLEKTALYRDLLEHPAKADTVHWTARKFHGHLRENLREQAGYSTVVRWLHEQDFRLKVPRPWPDRQDEALRAAFVEKVKAWLADAEVDLWYADETGVEGDPRPRRRWAPKGSHPTVTKNGDHLRMNVCGMVCPRTGNFYALEFSHSDTDSFQAFLDEASRDLAFERSRNLLICDNASWHKHASLRWGRFEPVYLPPYSPDLNPIERLWLLIKAEWFADFVAKGMDDLLARLDSALLWAIGRGPDNRRTCAIKTNL